MATFVGVLAVYAATAATSLPPGHDSAELATAAALPGIAHPPGYPLYTMLGFLATRLSPLEPIQTMNLLSAFFGALAAGLAAAAFARLSGNRIAGTAAALAFAFARTPWRLATQAEVFTLHLAILAALLLVAALWRDADDRGRRRAMLGLSVLLGLGLAHHHTVVLALPGLAGYLLLARAGRSLGLTPACLVGLVAGLLPYLYLPLRAAARPPLNWGNPDTLERLLWVITRSGYGGLQLSTASGSAPDPGAHLAAWARSLTLWQFPVLATLAGLAGAACAIGSSRGTSPRDDAAAKGTGPAYRVPATGNRQPGLPELVLLGSLVLLAGPGWALIGAQPAEEGYFDMLERFYAASYLGFAGLVALGIAALPGRIRPVALLLPLLALTLNLPAASERGHREVPEALAAMLDPLPAGALVVTGNDLTSGALLYARHVEGRPVEHLVPGLAASPWYLDQLPAEQAEALRRGGLAEALIQARSRGVAVHLDHIPPGVPGFFVPEGLLYRYLAPGEPLPDRVEASRRSLAILDGHPRPRPGPRPFWVRHLARTWAWAYRTAGEGLLTADPAEADRALRIASELEGR